VANARQRGTVDTLLAVVMVLQCVGALGSLAACTGLEPGPASGSDATAGEGSTAMDGPMMITSDGSTNADPTVGPATTSVASTGGTTDEPTSGDETAMMPDMGTMMPPPPKLCSLEAIDPDADPAAVIDAGDGDTQIPTLVGEVLLRNCGCHYTDDVPLGLYVDYVSNKVPMATLADFHVLFMGTFPMGFEDQPVYAAVEQRVVEHDPLPMPPYGCGVEGEPGMISAADLELLADWLAAAAPDGASFP
jgi:hypothetical protein